MIVVVRPEEAALYWHVFEPMFARVTATTHGCYEPVDVLKEILNGEQIMWAAWDKERGKIDAVMTTKIIMFPRRKVCAVVYISGDNMAAWKDEFISTTEKYAREQGCTAGSGCFRRGWARAWPGAQEHGVNIWKDLA